LIVAGVSAQTPVSVQQRAIVKAWNEFSASLVKENELLVALDQSMHTNPPWRVVDAREPAKRTKLIDGIIAEHLRRIKLLEKIRAEDLKSTPE
jgi:hypothetical protein